MLQKETGNFWFEPHVTQPRGMVAMLTFVLLLACGANAQVLQPIHAAAQPAQNPAPSRPRVIRNPNVQTPFDRVMGPHIKELASAAAKTHAGTFDSLSQKQLANAGTGIAGTNVNFPGFVAAPYLTITGRNQTTPASGYQAYASVAGDFNGDGYPDVALAQSDGTINVVLNPGPGGNLSQGIQIPPDTSATEPQGIVYLFWLETADLNGDGKLDLVGENYENSNLVVWMGNGDGTFQKAVSYSVAPKSGAGLSFLAGGGGFVIGDFNGDGAPDVATVETGFSFQTFTTVLTEQTFLNDGKGHLKPAPEADTVFKDTYQVASAGELSLVTDGSKISGIAFMIHNPGYTTAALGGTDILILGSKGDGTFTPAVEPTAPTLAENEFEAVPRTRLIATSLTKPAATGVATTDIIFMTGDGAVYDEPFTPQSGSFSLPAAQLLVGGNGTTEGGTRYNPYLRSNASSSSGSSTATPAIPFQQGINVADANGDGLPDIFVYSSGATYIYLNSGNGTFQTAPAQIIGGHAGGQQPQPQDFNGSGHTSFVVLDSQQLQLGYYQGDGTGLFYGAAAVAGTGAGSTLAISDNITVQAVGDFNGDGLADVIAQDWTNSASNNGYPDIVLGINNGNKPLGNETNNFTFTKVLKASTFSSLHGAFIEPVTFANPAGGTNVLFATTGGLSVITVNKGAASAPAALIPSGLIPCTPNFADAGDVNGDGILDIVVAYGGESSCNAGSGLPSGIFTFLGKKDGTFGSPEFTAYGSSLFQARLIDFNGDGSYDVVVNDENPAQATHGISILPNLANGSGGFDVANAVTPVSNYIVSDIVPGDYNSDGKQDLTLTTEGLFDPSADQVVPNSWGVLMLPGNGDFTFGTGTTVNPGFFPEWGSYADFNGDGAPDLALVEYGDTLTITNPTGNRVQLPSLVQILPNLGGGNFGPSVGEFDGYFEDTKAYDGQPSYSLSAYTFTGNFGNGQDLLVAGAFNSAEFLNQGTDALALAPSAAKVNQGQNVTLTAKLTQSAGNPYSPTGAISFYTNGTLLGAADTGGDGTASLTTSQLPLGANALTAVYGGDAHYNAANAVASATVVALPPPPPPPAPITPDFTLAATPGTLSLTQGATGVVTLTAAADSSFQGLINFTCSGAPSEASCLVNPGSVTLNQSQTGTVTVVVATTSKGSQSQAQLWKDAAGGVSLAGLILWTFPRRRRLPAMLLLLSLGLGAVAITGCGDGSKPATTTTPTAPAGNSGTPAGSTMLTITATAGSVTHTQTFKLQVTAP